MAEDLKKLAQTLHPLERKVFPLLLKHSKFEDLVKDTGMQEIEVLRALQWLSNKKLVDLKEDLRRNSLNRSQKIHPSLHSKKTAASLMRNARSAWDS